MKLVNPANKRKYTVLVVGTGLAGASAAASLSELGYNVKCFCFQDSPRRAHSIAAQGGINAAKNYRNDGDSIYRLFYDTVKGGDFRSREANVYRLAQISVNIIDQCVAQGVPFAREYGGLLANRSFGGAQVSRTFYARGQTGQQLLLGAYQALEKEIDRGGVTMYPRTEMLDLIVIDGRARGIVTRDMVTRQDRVAPRRCGRARHRRLRQRLLPLHQRQGLQRHRHLAGVQAGRGVRQPLLHPDPSHLHSGERRLPVEAHADERVAPERRPGLGSQERRATSGRRRRSPKPSAITTWSGSIPASATSLRATSPPGPPRKSATRAAAWARAGSASISTSPTPSSGSGEQTIRERYGNLFEMYQRITDENPYEVADADLPRGALHDGRALGRLQPDEHHPGPARDRRSQLLRSRRQPAGRQRADAGTGRRVLRPSRHHRRLPGLAKLAKVDASHPECPAGRGGRSRRYTRKLLDIKGKRRWTRSTASWASSCGTTAAWPATRPACRRRSS